MPYKVYLDAGHGGFDNGATYQGRLEKDDNLRLALAVGNVLANKGVDVGFTRTTDIYQSPVEKADIANKAGANVFVSLHRNSSEQPNTYAGVESLIYDEGGIKQKYAENINSKLEGVGFNNIGISIRPNLAVLRKTQMPSLIVEVGFINTDSDNLLFDSKFDEIAQAIADGIMETMATINQPKSYRVQVGLFRNYSNAQNMLDQLTARGYNGIITTFNGLYAVQIGLFDKLNEAVDFEQQLRAKGYDTLIVQG